MDRVESMNRRFTGEDRAVHGNCTQCCYPSLMVCMSFIRRFTVWLMVGLITCASCGTRSNDRMTRANEDGLACLERNDLRGAIAGFQKATALWPQEQVLWINLAYSFDIAGQRAEAMSAYETAMKLSNHSNLTIGSDKCEPFYLRYAVLSLDMRQTKLALEQIQHYDFIVQRSPTGNLAKGILHYSEGQYDKALQSLHRAEEQLSKIDDNSNSERKAWLQAVRLATLVKQESTPASLTAELAQLNQSNAPPLVLLFPATAFIESHRYEDALPVVEKITQFSPELGRGWHLYALCLEGLNRSDEAVPMLQKAFTAQKPDGEAVIHYAAAMMKRGLYEEALAALKELSAAPLATSDAPGIVPIVEVAIASIYAQRGQRLLAQQRVEHALQLDPYLPEAQRFYTQLTGNPPPLGSAGRSTTP